MPQEHEALARSMLYFLSDSPDARVFCIAGFHTGRAKMAPFFEKTVPQEGLEVEEIYEMDAEGVRRAWAPVREDLGERKKWLVVARLRRASK
jgi:nicotinamide N-methyltransferase